VRVTGAVLQPSDRRVKQDIVPVDTEAQLRNIQALGLYSYTLKPEWTASVGIADAPVQCGVLAQELQQLIPAAVRPAGDHTMADGSVIEQLLTVDKERLHMEALGAIKALANKSDRLEAMVVAQEQLSIDLMAELDMLARGGAEAEDLGVRPINTLRSAAPQVPSSLSVWVRGVAESVAASAKVWAEQLPVLAAALSLVPV
jgi:hypothetical protein